MQSQHFLFLQASKKREHQLLNPEFIGIAKQLGKSHLNKNHAKNERTSISNRVSYLQKEENMAEKKLKKKQKQLEMLMHTITRRQADLEWVTTQDMQKEAQKRAKEEAIAHQRELNLRRRIMNQQKIRESFLSLYGQNREKSQKLRNTQRMHDSMLKTKFRESLRQNQEKVLNTSLAKQEGRNKIANYFKQKNDLYTSRYKEKIRMEEQQAKKELQQAKKLNNISGQAKLRLEKSTQKIEEVTEQMKELAKKSKTLQMSRDLKWSNLSKNKGFSETKADSCKNPDLQLDRIIQRELSLNETELSKI